MIGIWLLVLVLSFTGDALVTLQSAPVYQPVDVGFQFSTPVNLANTLQNSVAGPLSLVLVVAFTGILVAGLFFPKFASPWTVRSMDAEPSSSWWHRLLEPLDADEAFEFMSELADPCRRKILCHVHTFVPFAPSWVQTIIRVISRNIRGISRYKEDVIHGLGGEDCHARYRDNCPHSIGKLLMMTKPVSRILEQQRRHFQSTGGRYFNFDF